MHKLIYLLLVVSAFSFAQTDKSTEIIRDPFNPDAEVRDDYSIRREWDREEKQAQEAEEAQRDLDEERAETDVVTPKKN